MKRLGRYEILKEIGRGAMGTVYRARDPMIGREVALKVISISGLNPADEEGYRQRFFREAQAAGQLSHGGIVTIHDVGLDKTTKTPFIVMEIIEGRTLEELGQSERMPPKRAVELTQQVAAALDYAHGRHVIHRDIKPANIIITPDGRATITDFGVAKLRTAQVTQTGQLVGTPAYMSPEQLTTGQVDGRTDIFALGVIFYWLLTREKPFPGDDPSAVMFKIFYKDPEPPAQVNPSLSSAYDYILGRLLAKDPEQRYQRGQELVDDLEDVKNGRPPRTQATFVPAAPATEETFVTASGAARTTALPESPLAGLGTSATLALPRPGGERRWLLPAGVAALLLLLVGGSGWWWWSRASGAASGADTPTGSSPTAVTAKEKEREGGQAAGQQQASTSPARQTTPPPTQTPSGPPSTPAAAKRRRRPAATATLRLTGKHNLDPATLRVSVDGKVVKTFRLTSKKKTISGSIRLPAGDHYIGISIDAPRDRFNEMKHVQGHFERNQTRTLEITMGKLGSVFGVGSITRNLTLRWLD